MRKIKFMEGSEIDRLKSWIENEASEIHKLEEQQIQLHRIVDEKRKNLTAALVTINEAIRRNNYPAIDLTEATKIANFHRNINNQK